jgi:excisionase family DNA binding protein
MHALLCNFFVICRVAITGEEVYTTEEVAGKLRVTPKTVREWIRRGELKAIDACQGYRIFKSDYEEFLASRRRRKERK